MGDGPLKIAFLWHMHQPYYKDLVTGKYALPWVRLHGIKDYYDMANILRGFPRVRQTFNLVPSLIDQILDYCDGGATGIYLEHAVKPASELDADEKAFVIKNFFYANWDNMIRPYRRYWELLGKRGRDVSDAEMRRMTRYFTEQDYLDLQVWFNVTWFDPMFKESDPLLKGLIEKGRDFTEQDKALVIEKQREVLRLIIPEYRDLWESGQIEVSATPYYHPILPLLVDTEEARTSSPGISLPRRFSHPEDAREQVRRAVVRFEELFGRRPEGMWPSEGSVSEAVIPIIAGEGIKWMATDEEVLARSLDVLIDRDYSGITKKPEVLYKPYRARKDESEVSVVFRDHALSDLIGFVYSKWDPKNAVEDFIKRLSDIRRSLAGRTSDGLVTVALDGENAWEHYRNDGRDFLFRLYERLSEEEQFEMTTVGGGIANSPDKPELQRLFPGSWINHNFNIWIGQEEDNAAWDALSDARDALRDCEAKGCAGPDALRLAWEEIYIAEGSDWCWWYGDDHSSENDREFDELFRKHLMNVYHLTDMEPPAGLFIPIIRHDRKSRPTVELTAFISPTLDGEVTSYFEWLAAGYHDVNHAGGTMHRSQSIISNIYYGFDLKNLFVRLDSNRDLTGNDVRGLIFCVHFLKPVPHRVEISLGPEKGEVSATLIRLDDEGAPGQGEELASIAAGEIIEMSVPFVRIGAGPDDEINLFISVKRGDAELEKWPYRGYISFNAPTEDFEARMWRV